MSSFQFEAVCVCGRAFEKTSPNQKYCSKYCSFNKYVYRKKEESKKNCKQCNGIFSIYGNSKQLFCKRECCEKYHAYTKKDTQKVRCLVCEELFKQKHPLEKYCCEICKEQSVLDRYQKYNKTVKEKVKEVVGYCIYVWEDTSEIFYVGIGSTIRRATNTHTTSSGQLSDAEVYRRQLGNNFKHRIIQDGLTENGALLIENLLINLLQPKYNIQKNRNIKVYGELTI